jgi:hypothetical protein
VDGRTNFAHGHFSERILSQQLRLRKRLSSHFYQNLGPAALARMEYNRTLWGTLRNGRTAAVGVSLETETLATKFAPEQQHRGEGNYQQRDQLLPIHAGKITLKCRCATKDLG